MNLASIQDALGSRTNAEWQKRVKQGADLDNLAVHVCLALVEYQPMLNLLQAIQQWAKMEGSLEPTTKYQCHLKCCQEAAATAQHLVWKRVGLALIQYPGSLLGPLKKPKHLLRRRRGTLPPETMRKGVHALQGALWRMRARSQRARRMGQASMSSQYFADSGRPTRPGSAGYFENCIFVGGMQARPPCKGHCAPQESLQ